MQTLDGEKPSRLSDVFKTFIKEEERDERSEPRPAIHNRPPINAFSVLGSKSKETMKTINESKSGVFDIDFMDEAISTLEHRDYGTQPDQTPVQQNREGAKADYFKGASASNDLGTTKALSASETPSYFNL
jgi:hypothetical protein